MPPLAVAPNARAKHGPTLPESFSDLTTEVLATNEIAAAIGDTVMAR